MGPLLVLIRLALRHRNTLTERMNTNRATAAAEIINQRRPLVVSYQGASSVGQTWREACITQNPKSAELTASRQSIFRQPHVYVCEKKMSGVQKVTALSLHNIALQESCLWEANTTKLKLKAAATHVLTPHAHRTLRGCFGGVTSVCAWNICLNFV